jgi:hypothetical protein
MALKPTVKEFISFVANNLSKQVYPAGYEISKHWKNKVDENLAVACKIASEIPNDDQATHFFNRVRRDTNIRDPGFDHSDGEAFGYHSKISKAIGDNRLNYVLETGTGFGNTARVFHRRGTTCYILVDLPENLIYSYAFLNMHFPDSKIGIVYDNNYVFRNRDFIFCPIQRFYNLNIPKLDLYLNTYSLGEMPQASIDHVLEQVHRLKPKYLYSENIMFANKRLHEDAGREDAGEIVLNLYPEWLPMFFNIRSEIIDWKGQGDNKAHRYIVSTLLQIVNLPIESIIESLINSVKDRQSEDWMGDFYFAALWDNNYVDRFLSILESYNTINGCTSTPDYNFDKIGEVMWLRRKLANSR